MLIIYCDFLNANALLDFVEQHNKELHWKFKDLRGYLYFNLNVPIKYVDSLVLQLADFGNAGVAFDTEQSYIHYIEKQLGLEVM